MPPSPEKIQLMRDDFGIYVVGGWPAETELASSTVGLFLKDGTEDLVEFRVANGRAIYRVHSFDFQAGRVYRASLEYWEETPGVVDVDGFDRLAMSRA